MTLAVWLIVWLFSHTPQVSFAQWNDWAVGLVVCGAIDVLHLLRRENA